MKCSMQALIKDLFVKKAHVDANIKFDRDIGDAAEQSNEPILIWIGLCLRLRLRLRVSA